MIRNELVNMALVLQMLIVLPMLIKNDSEISKLKKKSSGRGAWVFQLWDFQTLCEDSWSRCHTSGDIELHLLNTLIEYVGVT